MRQSTLSMRRWRAANPERARRTQREYVASRSPFQRRLLSFNPRYKAAVQACDLELLMVEQGGACALCGQSLSAYWEIDHIVPRSVGGSSDLTNLQLLCEQCNQGKWTWTVDEYQAHCARVVEFQDAYSKARKGT